MLTLRLHKKNSKKVFTVFCIFIVLSTLLTACRNNNDLELKHTGKTIGDWMVFSSVTGDVDGRTVFSGTGQVEINTVKIGGKVAIESKLIGTIWDYIGVPKIIGELSLEHFKGTATVTFAGIFETIDKGDTVVFYYSVVYDNWEGKINGKIQEVKTINKPIVFAVYVEDINGNKKKDTRFDYVPEN